MTSQKRPAPPDSPLSLTYAVARKIVNLHSNAMWSAMYSRHCPIPQAHAIGIGISGRAVLINDRILTKAQRNAFIRFSTVCSPTGVIGAMTRDPDVTRYRRANGRFDPHIRTADCRRAAQDDTALPVIETQSGTVWIFRDMFWCIPFVFAGIGGAEDSREEALDLLDKHFTRSSHDRIAVRAASAA